MNAAEFEDEKPLDPAVEAVRRRLARLMVVSIGIMMIGLLAVLGAIVYKASGPSQNAVTNGTFAIPAGMTVIDQSLDGDRIALRIKSADGAQTILIFSTVNGGVISSFPIASDIKK